MRTSIRRVAVTLVASTVLLGTAACGSDDADEPTDDTTSEAPADDEMSDAAENLVGAECEAYAEANPTGAGSIEGMAQEPVATAASGNELLSTLVSTVSGEFNPDVNLVDTLNNGEFTVLAPINSAFEALPEDTLATLQTPEGAETLSTVLTYHVIEGQLTPDEIAGSQTTVQGDAVEITGEGEDLKFNDANLVCGGVKTANATVYMIDSVLMPPA